MSKWHAVCHAAELPAGGRKLVQIRDQSIGVFNVDGQFVAVLNVCPHQLAPVCAGALTGTTAPSAPGEFIYGREGRILRCPWHGWEYDLLSGQCLTDRRKLKHFAVKVADGVAYVQV